MMIIDQEKLVDNIIVSDIIKTYPELKKLIETCSPYEVRGKILSVLDPRNDLHYDYKEFHELNLECEELKYLDEIAVTLRNYVRVADCEKEKYAEVMTPIPLVDEMLDTLPKKVWSNPNLKWLDPCAGVGTFPSVVVQRLMKGLKKVIPNKNKRYRHIIENMIYVCEIQAKNMFIFHCIFDRPNIFELNTFYGSFLSDEFNEHMTDVWGVDKFDIIIGNPPYQTSTTHGKKVTGNGALWVLFNVKCLEILKDEGYFTFITPDSWSAPTYDLMGSRESLLNDYYKKYNLYYINFDKHFDVGVNTSVISLQKSNNYSTTKIKIKDVVLEINLNNFNFLPKDLSNISLSIHSKLLSPIENKNKIKMRWTKPVTSNKINDIQNDEFKYKIIDNNSYKPIRYGKYEDIDTKRTKLLFPYIGKYQVISDEQGEYGAKSQVSILFTDNVESAFSFYNSKLFNFIMNSNKWTQYLLTQILNFIEQPNFDKIYTDNDVYILFNLTKEEINYIETQIK